MTTAPKEIGRHNSSVFIATPIKVEPDGITFNIEVAGGTRSEEYAAAVETFLYARTSGIKGLDIKKNGDSVRITLDKSGTAEQLLTLREVVSDEIGAIITKSKETGSSLVAGLVTRAGQLATMDPSQSVTLRPLTHAKVAELANAGKTFDAKGVELTDAERERITETVAKIIEKTRSDGPRKARDFGEPAVETLFSEMLADRLSHTERLTAQPAADDRASVPHLRA